MLMNVSINTNRVKIGQNTENVNGTQRSGKNVNEVVAILPVPVVHAGTSTHSAPNGRSRGIASG